MNEAHQACGGDEWRGMMRNVILPWAVGEIDLGDDVLEVGPGYGATTDVLCEKVGHITSVEIDEQLASMLTERFAQADNVEIVHGDGTALALSRRSVHGCRVLHDAAPRPDHRAAGSPVRGGRSRAQARRRARCQRQPGQRRAQGPPRGRHVQPGRSRLARRSPARGRVRARSRCGRIRTDGRLSRPGSSGLARRGSRPR